MFSSLFLFLSFSFLFSFQLGVLVSAAGPVVTTSVGSLEGLTVGSVNSFLGIPYAKPPQGAHRWKPPVPYPKFATTRSATSFGASCAQIPVPGENKTYSEDCLFLNVFAPASSSSSSNLPVLVYMHGGSFVSGSSTDYPAYLLLSASPHFIAVTFNYRLGPLGHFPHPHLLAAGGVNFAQMDQQLALQWVQNNIAAFGGNPQQVTLMGLSSGAQDTVQHLMLPSSWSLFHQVFIESFGPGILYTYDYVLAAAQLLAQTVNCSNFALSCLRKVSFENLVYNSTTAQAQNAYFVPIVDGWTLYAQPTYSLMQGNFRPNTNILIGNTPYEGNEFAQIFTGGLTLTSPPLYQLLMTYTFGPLTPYASEYIPWYQSIANTTGYWDAYASFFNDGFFICQTQFLTDYYTGALQTVSQTQTGKLWRYLFTHLTSVRPPYFQDLNVTHTSDTPYWWNNPLFQLIYPYQFDAAEQTLALQTVQYLSNYVRFGDPNGQNATLAWGTSTATSRPTLLLDTPISSTTSEYRSAYCDQWSGLITNFSLTYNSKVDRSTSGRACVRCKSRNGDCLAYKSLKKICGQQLGGVISFMPETTTVNHPQICCSSPTITSIRSGSSFSYNWTTNSLCNPKTKMAQFCTVLGGATSCQAKVSGNTQTLWTCAG